MLPACWCCVLCFALYLFAWVDVLYCLLWYFVCYTFVGYLCRVVVSVLFSCLCVCIGLFAFDWCCAIVAWIVVATWGCVGDLLFLCTLIYHLIVCLRFVWFRDCLLCLLCLCVCYEFLVCVEILVCLLVV